MAAPKREHSTSSRRFAAKASLLALGLALALVASELVLQAGAVAVQWAARHGDAVGFGSQKFRILFFGDSNTYGLYVQPSEAYPKVFERLWNSAGDGRGEVEVVNLAYPGNSSRVRNVVGDAIRKLHPDLVAVMIGANDFWTQPEPPAAQDGASVWQLLDRSRLYRLFRIFRASCEQQSVEISDIRNEGGSKARAQVKFGDFRADMGFDKAEGVVPEWRAGLVDNELAISGVAREEGIPLLWLTYGAAAWPYGEANSVIRETARANGWLLVDPTPRLVEACQGVQKGCPHFFADLHPTPSGHELVAQALFDGVEALARQGRLGRIVLPAK